VRRSDADGSPFLPRRSARDRRLFAKRRAVTRFRLLIATVAVAVAVALVWLGFSWA
jgi:hypothetical protein